MDLSLEERITVRETPAVYVFQSLFSWISLWKSEPKRAKTALWCVSILVFMDLSLEDVSLPSLLISFTMFQSLFSWISLWKTNPIPIETRRLYVSILVFMDLSLEVCAEIAVLRRAK